MSLDQLLRMLELGQYRHLEQLLPGLRFTRLLAGSELVAKFLPTLQNHVLSFLWNNGVYVFEVLVRKLLLFELPDMEHMYQCAEQ